MAHSRYMSSRKLTSVRTLLTMFHCPLRLKLRVPKSWRWQAGMKLKPAGRSQMKLQLSEDQFRHFGSSLPPWALRSFSNCVIPVRV